MPLPLPAPLRDLGRTLLDMALPPRCLGCGTLVSDPGALCPDCFSGITHLTRPYCEQCGHPFPVGGLSGPGTLCADCLGDPPAFSRARAVWIYDEGSKPLILRFKHADRTDAAPAFARWMSRAGAELITDSPVLVPVPLHPRRLWHRRYNQAALLSQSLARIEGLEHRPLALVRSRATASQGHKGQTGRWSNVRGAFAMTKPEQVEGRPVILVDDVMTTGATLNECAKVLLRGGAARVDALVLARVPLDVSE
ncbi:double zinc ribbon domain-containing protein [Rhodospirillum sp. A1_3_36]|uniref:double zinc ribbon domain-containing protein n=1 Tax=Rhodospirillum sp. A1_3_36 TaxID=3391666 RepID=UPI0039A613C4